MSKRGCRREPDFTEAVAEFYSGMPWLFWSTLVVACLLAYFFP